MSAQNTAIGMMMTKFSATHHFMELALQQAKEAYGKDEVPVGAVIVLDNEVIAQAHNMVEIKQLPYAHAEFLAITVACQQLGSKFLNNCDLYVTLEPCPMCAQVISFSKIRRLYFGVYDLKSGGVENGARIFNASSCHHSPEIYGGINENEARELLTSFFQQKR